MKYFNKVAAACCIVSVTACSGVPTPSLGGVGELFGRSDTLEVSTKYTPSPNAPQVKYAVTMRMGKFADERKMGDARLIGSGGWKVKGLTRDEIVISQDVASYVALIMRNRLDDSGFQVLGEQASNAMYEMSGTVKELTLNVKGRDEVSISVEYSLKEVATGKLAWSALVVEKASRYPGVSGDNRADVAEFLRKSLWITSGKAATALSDALVSAKPELFNLTPGVKPISGVTVYVSPAGASSAASAPNYASPQGAAVLAAPAAVVAPAYTPRASATSGLLLVNTNPARAKVYVDGVYFGLSPLRVEVDPGVHAVSVKLEGYKMATEKVSVRRGDNTEMDLVLER